MCGGLRPPGRSDIAAYLCRCARLHTTCKERTSPTPAVRSVPSSACTYSALASSKWSSFSCNTANAVTAAKVAAWSSPRSRAYPSRALMHNAIASSNRPAWYAEKWT